ncbi:MAG: hypothetical protein VR78_11050 [Hoeflea sp. BRH_c9]|nr:MAG: hypothetical protein VR78_11050 [Hoeflea sp. BRH_c9]
MAIMSNKKYSFIFYPNLIPFNFRIGFYVIKLVFPTRILIFSFGQVRPKKLNISQKWRYFASIKNV